MLSPTSKKRTPLLPILAAAAALVVLVGGVGALLVILGGGLGGSDRGATAPWVIGALVVGAGWLLIEVAGSVVFEAALHPFRLLYRRFVPNGVQTRLSAGVGGPVLLLGLLMVIVVLVFIYTYS
jgi:hypothetical protein